MKIKENASCALTVNLSSAELNEHLITGECMSKYVSGPALALYLYQEYASDGIVITAGAYGNLVAVAFRSPQSGRVAVNTFPSNMSSALKSLGYCGVIINGKNSKSGVLFLDEKGVRPEESEFFRKVGYEDIKSYCQTENISILCTGKAAENNVKSATAICDGILTGRGGLGAAMGNMNLKAVAVSVKDKVSPADVGKTDISKLISKAINAKAVPSVGFSGVADARTIHLHSNNLPPFDAVMMLGPCMGSCDVNEIKSRYGLCLSYGLDPVSTGNILGQKKLRHEDVKALINEFAEGRTEEPDNHITIGNIECGPLDYRGCFTQVINDCNFRWYPQYIGKYVSSPLLAAFCCILNDILVMGLQSLGISGFLKQRPRKISLKNIYRLGCTTFKLYDLANASFSTPAIPDFFRTDPGCTSVVPYKALIKAYERAVQSRIIFH